MRLSTLGQALFSKLDWEGWLYQLVSALIAGGAGAVTSAVVTPIVDSEHFNPSTLTYYKMIGGMFLGTGILKMCVFLQTHPVPIEKTTVITTLTVEKKVEGVPPETPKEP